jgi:hypothetical protein
MTSFFTGCLATPLFLNPFCVATEDGGVSADSAAEEEESDSLHKQMDSKK